MGEKHLHFIRGAAFVALALALSGCDMFGSDRSGIGGAIPYGQTAEGGITVASFDPTDARQTCVNDLTIYRAHLQVPASPAVDLNKPVNAYVQEAGSAGAAINVLNGELNELNRALDGELAQRNPFDVGERARSDDAIAVIEDGIFLNEALAEALECRL